MHAFLRIAASGLAVALAACSSKNTGASRDSASAGATTSQAAESARGAPGMKGMPGMGGMMGGMMSDSMMAQMHSHMQMMDRMSPDRMKAMMPMHRQIVANMLSQFSSEMKRMNMSGDPAWIATVDSIRQDLVHMPEMSGQELKAMMPAHHTRIMRLMQMHRDMMARMR